MRTWTLSLVLFVTTLCWQSNAKADDNDGDYQHHRHHRSDQDDRRNYRDYDADQRDGREHRYDDGQNYESRDASRHHRHKGIRVGPVTIDQ